MKRTTGMDRAEESASLDISDLLVVDDRLPFGWRDAHLDSGELVLSFPDARYRVDTERSVVVDGTWYLCVAVAGADARVAAAIVQERLTIPENASRVMYGLPE